MPSIRLGRVVVAIAGAILLATLVVTAGASARTNGPSSSVRQILPGSKPAWTSVAPQAAAVPSGRLVHARVWLAPRNAAQLDALAQAVSDPSSAAVRPVHHGRPVRRAVRADAGPGRPGDAVAHRVRPERDCGRAGQSLRRGLGHAPSAIAAAFGTQLADYRRQRTDDAGADDRPVGAGLARRTRPRRHRAHARSATRSKPADFGAPDAFVQRARRARATTASRPRGRCRSSSGQTLPYAVCGYTPNQLRGAYGVDGVGNDAEPRPWPDRRDHRRLRRADRCARTRTGTRSGTATGRSRRGQFQDRSVPEDAVDRRRLRRQRLVRRAGARRRGRARRWLPRANVLYYGAASCFDDDLLAAAGAGRRTTTRRRSSPTRGASRRSSSIDGSSSQHDRREPRRRVRVDLQAGRRPGDRLHTSPRATTATSSRTLGLSSIPTTRPATRGSRRSAAPRSRSTGTTTGCSRPAGAPRSTALSSDGKPAGPSAVPFLYGAGGGYQPGLPRARGTSAASSAT